MAEEQFDVVQVGYGPISMTLAMMLAIRGWKVGIFERFPAPYVLPRAVCVDHELYRVLHANGYAEQIQAVAAPAPLYQWFNAEWKQLLELDWTRDSVSGGPEVNFIHQPTLEASLDEALQRTPNVSIQRGWEAVGLAQDDAGVSLTLRHAETGAPRTVRARYLVGCDGANSFVRRELGIAQEDLGFEADWLVVDMLLKPGITPQDLGIPLAGQYCNPTQPTTIVPGGIEKGGRICRRWEFMRLPHESREEMERPERVWELLIRWITPEQGDLVRHTIYTFRSLVANEWRRGRILLAGDAAHVTPPFMGQGMCAGMRDAINLTWKLDQVLRGQATDALLDTYMQERRPHCVDVTRLAIYLGKVICIPDEAEAKKRDEAFFNGTAEPPPPFPSLVAGLLQSHNGALAPAAGHLAPHGAISWHGQTGRLDDIAGTGWRILTLGDAAIPAEHRDFLAAIGARIVPLRAAGSPGDAAEDLDGKLIPFLQSHGLQALIVRPDFYSWGGAATLADLPATIGELRHALAAAGVTAAQ